MEYAEGGTLADFLIERSGNVLDEEQILHLFAQIVLSLHHLHSRQVLHRDLKTQNILLNRTRTVCKLSDFGISKILSNTKSKATTVSCPGEGGRDPCGSLGDPLGPLGTMHWVWVLGTLPSYIPRLSGSGHPFLHVTGDLRRQALQSEERYLVFGMCIVRVGHFEKSFRRRGKSGPPNPFPRHLSPYLPSRPWAPWS